MLADIVYGVTCILVITPLGARSFAISLIASVTSRYTHHAHFVFPCDGCI